MDGRCNTPGGVVPPAAVGRDWRATATNRRNESALGAPREAAVEAAAHTTCPLFDAVAQAAMALWLKYV